MHTNEPFIFIGLLVLLGIFLIFMVIYRKKHNRPPNYRAFTVIGIVWIPLGIATQNHALLILGIIFALVGIIKRKSWKEQPKWSELSPQEKRTKLIIIILLSILLVLGVVFYFLTNS